MTSVNSSSSVCVPVSVVLTSGIVSKSVMASWNFFTSGTSGLRGAAQAVETMRSTRTFLIMVDFFSEC